MAVDLSTLGGAGAQFFDNNGVPLAGGKLYSYAASTTTPKATFTSSAGNVPHTNPIILDSSGRVPSGGEIWLTSGEPYKFVLETPTSILLGTWDNIYGYTSGSADASTEVQIATAGQTLFVLNQMAYTPGSNTLGVYIDGVNQVVNNAYIETNATSVTFVSGLHEGAVVKFININIGATDANVVTYEPGFTGSVATTVADKLQQYVSVKDFGAVGDGVADDTVAVQTALDNANYLYFPEGEYLCDALSTTNTALSIYGAGRASVIKTISATAALEVIPPTTTQAHTLTIRNISFDNGVGTPTSFIRLENNINPLLEQIYFSNVSATYCIENDVGYGLTIRDCVFSGITGSGFVNRELGGAAIEIENCDFTRLTGSAIRFENTTSNPQTSVRVSKTIVEYCDGNGIEFNKGTGGGYAWNINLDNVYFEANIGFDIDLSPNGSAIASYVHINDCPFVVTPTINLGSRGVLTAVNCQNSGGNACTVSGSAFASVNLINSINFTQSGTFKWQDSVAAPLTKVINWSGASAQSLGVNVNSNGTARAFLLLVTRQTSSGNATGSNLYMVRCGFDGDNYTATLISSDTGSMGGGSMTFTFSVSSGILQIAGPSGGEYSATIIQNF